MASRNFPPCPVQLKVIQHYLKLATDYEERNPVISYWARLYALQTALKIDRKSPEAKVLLTALMDYLEKFKKEHSDNEAVTNDVAGQAVIENEAHKLFSKADTEDREAHFDKNLVKTFYTSGVLMDVVEVFGPLSEEITGQRKYAKWKATYIHNCLKNGETPHPGPIGEENEFSYGFGVEGSYDHASSTSNNPDETQELNLPTVPSDSGHYNQFSQQPTYDGPSTHPNVASQEHNYPEKPLASGGLQLTPEHFSKAQKYCKYAVSSIDYEDINTAVGYLQKALSILTTGKEQ